MYFFSEAVFTYPTKFQRLHLLIYNIQKIISALRESFAMKHPKKDKTVGEKNFKCQPFRSKNIYGIKKKNSEVQLLQKVMQNLYFTI